MDKFSKNVKQFLMIYVCSFIFLGGAASMFFLQGKVDQNYFFYFQKILYDIYPLKY